MKYIMSCISLILLVPMMLLLQNVKEAMPQILTSVSQVVFCTLFPMNVLLRLFCFSPICQKLGNILSKTRVWTSTGLSVSYLPSVLAGQLSGFPMTACLLPEGENRDTALALGSIASPAFLSAILTVRTGLLLWLNQILVLYIFASVKKTKQEKIKRSEYKFISFSEALTSGISSAVAISGAMIFFSCIVVLIPEVFREAASSVLEIGTAVSICKSPLFLSVALSFSGLCVLSQISFCAEDTDIKPYMLSRVFLFFPTLTFFVFEKIRIFQTLLIIFVFLLETNRRNTCKKK